jgi:hypothetical protein
MKPKSLQKADAQYQQINAAIDKILEKIQSCADGDQKTDLQNLLEEQLHAQRQIEETLLSKDLDTKKLSQRMLKEAFGNVLLFLVHKSEDIIEAIEALELEGINVPSGRNAYKKICKEYGEDRIISIIKTKTEHVKYVISAINEDETLLLDYEWIMDSPQEGVFTFGQCCYERKINPRLFRYAIQTASIYSTERLIAAYEQFQSSEEKNSNQDCTIIEYSFPKTLLQFA